jgi:O-antigen/teichoic acid export membrane protein
LKYKDVALPFSILLAAFCGNMLLRNLYGNLLSAVGKMKANTLISIITLILLLLFALLFVGKYGVTGMAISLSLSMLMNGFMLMIAFNSYLKNLK